MKVIKAPSIFNKLLLPAFGGPGKNNNGINKNTECGQKKK
jgi:hypothetical protein